MKNRLWTGEERAQLEKDLGPLMAENEIRRTGRSTACALKVIADAMQNPGVAFPIVDHASRPGFTRMNKHLSEQVEDLVKHLHLKFLTVFHGSDGSDKVHFLRYDIFE